MQKAKITIHGDLMKLRLGSFSETSNYTRFINVSSLKDAKKKWLKFISDNNFGASQVLGGDVFNDDDQVIAIISYNGRCWKPSKIGNEYYQCLPDTDNEIHLD